MPHSIERLLSVMASLRDPQTGCPWDVKQSFETILPYTIEEAYEVAEAIESGDMSALRDELGDLLFQVVFHARMAEELGAFSFDDVAAASADKMIRRHPHVFSDASFETEAEQKAAWEAEKAKERDEKAKSGTLDGVSAALPALTRAVKLQARAADVGFDWPDLRPVFEKIAEETNEVADALDRSASFEKIEDEVGDLLFACVNLARKLSIDPESALRRCNKKFERRFRFIEAGLAQNGKKVAESDLDEMEALWTAAKHLEQDGA